jgi:INO80 complex subunit B
MFEINDKVRQMDDSDEEMDFSDTSGMSETKKAGGTARQRRMRERSSGESSVDEEFYALPMDDPSRKKHFTSEEVQSRKVEKNRRRRIMADKKLEEVKQATIDKLLKRKERDDEQAVGMFVDEETIPTDARHVFKREGVFVLWPQNVEFPLDKIVAKPVPHQVPCVVCGKQKRYSHSKTHQPLCSLECYRKIAQ